MVKLTDHNGNEYDLVPKVSIDWGHNPAEFDWATIVRHEIIALNAALVNKMILSDDNELGGGALPLLCAPSPLT